MRPRRRRRRPRRGGPAAAPGRTERPAVPGSAVEWGMPGRPFESAAGRARAIGHRSVRSVGRPEPARRAPGDREGRADCTVRPRRREPALGAPGDRASLLDESWANRAERRARARRAGAVEACASRSRQEVQVRAAAGTKAAGGEDAREPFPGSRQGRGKKPGVWRGRKTHSPCAAGIPLRRRARTAPAASPGIACGAPCPSRQSGGVRTGAPRV